MTGFYRFVLFQLLISVTWFNCWSQNGEWDTIRALYPEKKLQASCVFEDKIYVFGGLSYETGESICVYGSRSVHVYDPSCDSWEARKQMPNPRADATAELVNNKIYIIGGRSGLPTLRRYSDIVIYDPLKDSWDDEPIEMLSRRKSHGSCVVDDKIFVIGGLDDDENGVNMVEVFNTTDKIWEVQADMPTARGNITVSYLDGKIYVFGGNNSYKVLPLSNIEIYDISSNSWKSASAVLPKGLTSHSALVYDQLIYLAGGVSYLDKLVNNYDIYAFDPLFQEFFFISQMPESGGDISFHQINHEFYFLEGQDLYADWAVCDNINLSLKYIPVSNPIMAVDGRISGSFMTPVNDSISFSTSFINNNGRLLEAKIRFINSKGQLVDSIKLFDDGKHADLRKDDGVYGNYIKNLQQEDLFQIEVISASESGINEFVSTNTVRPFCTLGPISIDNPSQITEFQDPVTGEKAIFFDLKLLNEGITRMAENVSVELFCNDSEISLITSHVYIGDILPGQSIKGRSKGVIKISPGYKGSWDIEILAAIKSGNVSFWNDKIIIKPEESEQK